LFTDRLRDSDQTPLRYGQARRFVAKPRSLEITVRNSELKLDCNGFVAGSIFASPPNELHLTRQTAVGPETWELG
jgi:hypothetical protein